MSLYGSLDSFVPGWSAPRQAASGENVIVTCVVCGKTQTFGYTKAYINGVLRTTCSRACTAKLSRRLPCRKSAEEWHVRPDGAREDWRIRRDGTRECDLCKDHVQRLLHPDGPFKFLRETGRATLTVLHDHDGLSIRQLAIQVYGRSSEKLDS